MKLGVETESELTPKDWRVVFEFVRITLPEKALKNVTGEERETGFKKRDEPFG